MNLSEYHLELKALTRRRLIGLGLHHGFTGEELDEIYHMLANDMLFAVDNAVDMYTDQEWRAAHQICQ